MSEENLKWFQSNSDEIRDKFENKVVAIKNKKIVASADNNKELLSSLGKNIDSSEVLIGVISPKGENKGDLFLEK